MKLLALIIRIVNSTTSRFLMIELAQRLEGYQTDLWAIDAILDVEILTQNVIDPCCGYKVIGEAAERRGHYVKFIDIHAWSNDNNVIIKNFLNTVEDLSNVTVFMNPPFSLACQFVDHCRLLGARKIICFQRHAWREGSFDKGAKRGEWWERNPPSRIWLCGDRAQCLRFDLIGEDISKPPTAHSWFVWERGHRGAEVTRALYKGHHYNV